MQVGKAWIDDDELREAFAEMLNGQADNLGGGVWRVYQFLYAKKDQSNISPRQLADLRELAKTYGGLTEMEIQRLLDMKEFVEIPHE
jgi:hypothetical protein